MSIHCDLLALIASGQARSTQDLARLVSLDRVGLQLILCELEGLGYLQRPGTFSCEPLGCAGCRRPCQKTPGAEAWRLTEKGHKLVTGHSSRSPE